MVDPIEITVMGFRESLMRYFKNIYLEATVEGVGIEMRPLSTRVNHTYQDIAQVQKARYLVCLNNTPVMCLSKVPDTIMLLDIVLSRSPEMRHLKTGLMDFQKRYLRGVKLEINRTRDLPNGTRLDRSRGDPRNDIDLFTARVRPVATSVYDLRNTITNGVLTTSGEYLSADMYQRIVMDDWPS